MIIDYTVHYRLWNQRYESAVGLHGRRELEPHLHDSRQQLHEPNSHPAHVLPRELELLAGGHDVPRDPHVRERVPGHELLRHRVQLLCRAIPLDPVDRLCVLRGYYLRACHTHVLPN